MNERIKELKAQARDFYLAQEDLDCSITELHELVDAKFAELIVRECARKADQIENYVKTDNSCGDYLKKHFGVEE